MGESADARAPPGTSTIARGIAAALQLSDAPRTLVASTDAVTSGSSASATAAGTGGEAATTLPVAPIIEAAVLQAPFGAASAPSADVPASTADVALSSATCVAVTTAVAMSLAVAKSGASRPLRGGTGGASMDGSCPPCVSFSFDD